jgi:hypothetical protein
MGVTEAARAAAGRTANGPQEFSLFGKRRELLATIFHPESQAFARVTPRAENHLREVEWRIIRLGQLVDADQADRSLVVDRVGVACELARLDEEATR